MQIRTNVTHDPKTPILVFCQNKILAKQSANGVLFPTHDEVVGYCQEHGQVPISITDWQNNIYLATEFPCQIEIDKFEYQPIKPFFIQQSDKLQRKISNAFQWVYFSKTHQYCGQCGDKTHWSQNENAKQCQNCQHVYYPKISPVVMVLVKKGREILLARSPHFSKGVYSALAGFVEVGESLAQTAIREVKEEVGLQICNLTYFDSQAWPFPHSQMIAFFAEHAGGEIQEDKVEIEHAAWFNKNNLPRLPSKASIAYRLIEDWLENQ